MGRRGFRISGGVVGFALCALMLAGCNDKSDSSQASSSTTSQSAPPAPGTAQVSWEAPTATISGTSLTNLAGYTVFYGTSPAALNQSVNVTDPTATSFTVSGLTSGTWYFTVAAYSADGTESQPSEVVSATVT
jgi:Fibronectin type III domain